MLWSSLAVFGVGGVGLFFLVLALALAVNKSKSERPLVDSAICLLIVVVLLALILPGVQVGWNSPRRERCRNNLKQISLALLMYEEANHCLPPPYIADKNGKPMHSWRVLILPYIEQTPLYHRYNFNEPWDGPNNKKLLAQRPNVFVCPSDKGVGPTGTTTSYLAVVGKSTLWSGDPSRPAQLVPDEARGKTAMVVEAAHSGVNWTEPKDFCLDNPPVNDQRSLAAQLPSVHPRHSRGFFYHKPPADACVALADGHVSSLPGSALGDEKIRNLLSVGGFDENEIASYTIKRINWTNCCSLAVWIASVALLFYRAWRSRKATTRNECDDAWDRTETPLPNHQPK